MIYFNNDYSEGCHEAVLRKLNETNMEQTSGYGTDPYCAQAAQMIRALCENDKLHVHFLVGGTQTNLTVIDAALRPHQGVLGANTAHVQVHETGAIEATGHKVLSIFSDDGKISADQIDSAVTAHFADEAAEHTVQPKMVYISNPTELGTIYTLAELESISETCHKHGLYLFLDGARLGYGLTAKGNDVTMADLARLCDVFYIGGTKVGALFGEAVVISNPAIADDFRYLIKQHGGMLAKGRLLGLQFATLFTDGLYFDIARHAIAEALRIKAALTAKGIRFLIDSDTNQQFPIFTQVQLETLSKEFLFSVWQQIDAEHTAVRICTSWATKSENVDKLIVAIEGL